MGIAFERKVKALDEYAEILKHELLFSMAEGKPENMPRIVTIKRELDKAAPEKMRLRKIYHSTINKGI